MLGMMALASAIRKHYSKIGRMGSKARNAKLSSERKHEIAKKAAQARWENREKVVSKDGQEQLSPAK